MNSLEAPADQVRPPVVAICSLVRNGMEYLATFRRQLEALSEQQGCRWRLYCLEGDSSDDSWSFLQAWAQQDPRLTIAQLSVGGAANNQELAHNWARAANACLDLVPASGDHTHLLWLESDLCFPAELLTRLLRHHCDVVAPIVYLGGYFYDTWGFRGVDGRRWQNKPPYHPDYQAHQLLPMQSVGSCVLFSRKLIDHGIRMKADMENGLLVGMCTDARAAGMQVWADTSTAILHPVDLWQKQLWQLTEVSFCDGQGQSSGSKVAITRSELAEFTPRLDPEKIVEAHRPYWQDLFRTLHSNRLLVQIDAHTQPRRHYRMRITRLEPSGVWAHPIARRAAPWLQRQLATWLRSWQPLRATGDLPRSPRPRLADLCVIQIHLVNS